jgi:hypothetical protein
MYIAISRMKRKKAARLAGFAAATMQRDNLYLRPQRPMDESRRDQSQSSYRRAQSDLMQL